MESGESKKAFDRLQKALGITYALQGIAIRVTREIQTADGKPIAYAIFGVDENGKKVLSIESVKGDNEYISEISQKRREKIEKLGFKFNEE
jgi:hypothetical protein